MADHVKDYGLGCPELIMGGINFGLVGGKVFAETLKPIVL